MKKRICAMTLAALLLSALFIGTAQPAEAYDMGKPGQPVTVSMGGYHTAAVKTDGSLWTWGDNSEGQLGTGGEEDSGVPVKMMDGVAAISLGYMHTAAIKTDGSLWIWGNNDAGQLGNGIAEEGAHSSVPEKMMDGVAAVALGYSHAAVIKTDGSLWTWGSNWFGELGNTGKKNYSGVPVKVMDGVVTVALGEFLSAAVKTDGSLWTWGNNNSGQLGTGNNGWGNYSAVPAKVMEDVAAVSLGGGHVAALKTDGSLWTWGSNRRGQLGNGSMTDSGVPVKVMDGVASVSVGDYHSAAIKTDGSLWTWGYNEYGQLGNGSKENSSVPVKVMDGVTAISLGGLHTAAVKTDGSLWTWGSNDNGQLGNGSKENSSVPEKVMDGVALPGGVSAAEANTQPQSLTGGSAAITVTVKGVAVSWTDAAPFIDESNRTMVPLRAVGDALGLSVSWDGSERAAIFTDGAKSIRFSIGITHALTESGTVIEMDTAAAIVNDRTYAPIRYLAEYFGYTVAWEGATRTVAIG